MWKTLCDQLLLFFIGQINIIRSCTILVFSLKVYRILEYIFYVFYFSRRWWSCLRSMGKERLSRWRTSCVFRYQKNNQKECKHTHIYIFVFNTISVPRICRVKQFLGVLYSFIWHHNYIIVKVILHQFWVKKMFP